MKNRYGERSDPPPKRQPPIQAISFQPYSQNTKTQTFNYMTIGYKLFPSPDGKFLGSWALADDVIPRAGCK
jgi:hypothetical protein